MSPSTRKAPEAARPQPLLRLCTICDGVDAVIRLAAWLGQLPSDVERLDLEFPDAMERLQDDMTERWDLVVIVPDAGREAASPRLIQALLAETKPRSQARLLLLPPGVKMALPDGAGCTVLQGPPFPPFHDIGSLLHPTDAIVAPDTPLPGFWRRLLPGAVAAPIHPPPPQQGPLQVLGIQPAAGGAGASTFALTLAGELVAASPGLEICLIDLDLQFGTLAGFLDLLGEPRILDLYRAPEAVDAEAFRLCLRDVRPGLRVLLAPEEILPLDAITPAGLAHLLSLARGMSDLVILDLPPAVCDWCEAAFEACDQVCLVSEMDVRSSTNIRRLRALIGPQALPPARLRVVVNRAPLRRDHLWQERRLAFEAGLAQPLAAVLPLGGDALRAAADGGIGVERLDPANPFRRAVADYAESLLPRLDPRQSARPGE